MATYTLYDASIGASKSALTALSNIIDKAEASPVAAAVPTARLLEDMLPFTSQIFFVVNSVHKLVCRLTGAQPKEYENNFNTYEAMRAVIADLRTQLDAVDRETVNKRETEIVSFGQGKGKPEVPMQVWQHAHGWAVPNMYFHVVTAYAIARKEGVKLEKSDYLAPFLGPFLPK